MPNNVVELSNQSLRDATASLSVEEAHTERKIGSAEEIENDNRVHRVAHILYSFMVAEVAVRIFAMSCLVKFGGDNRDEIFYDNEWDQLHNFAMLGLVGDSVNMIGYLICLLHSFSLMRCRVALRIEGTHGGTCLIFALIFYGISIAMMKPFYENELLFEDSGAWAAGMMLLMNTPVMAPFMLLSAVLCASKGCGSFRKGPATYRGPEIHKVLTIDAFIPKDFAIVMIGCDVTLFLSACCLLAFDSDVHSRSTPLLLFFTAVSGLCASVSLLYGMHPGCSASFALCALALTVASGACYGSSEFELMFGNATRLSEHEYLETGFVAVHMPLLTFRVAFCGITSWCLYRLDAGVFTSDPYLRRWKILGDTLTPIYNPASHPLRVGDLVTVVPVTSRPTDKCPAIVTKVEVDQGTYYYDAAYYTPVYVKTTSGGGGRSERVYKKRDTRIHQQYLRLQTTNEIRAFCIPPRLRDLAGPNRSGESGVVAISSTPIASALGV